MVIHTCESCNYSTKYVWVYRNHLISKKHMKLQSSAQEYAHSCEYCAKKYKSVSGFYKHKNICKKKPIPSETVLLERITHLENEILEIKNTPIQTVSGELIQNSMVVNAPVTAPITTTTTNSNNTNSNNTNNIYINYLNTNCKDAMNITDFVKSMVFSKEDMLQFLTDHYDKVLAKLITERLEQLPSTQRPLHCITATTDTSAAFAVKTTEWKQEEHEELNTHIRDVEDDDEYMSMTIPHTIDEIKDKVFDTYEEERKAEPKLNPIRPKMCSGNGTEGKIRILHHLLDKDNLQIPDVV